MSIGIGKRIKEKRLELGLTQMELAQRMGYTSKAAVCKVERGDDNITADRVSKFAKALNCDISYLMGWDMETQVQMIYEESQKQKKEIQLQFSESLTDDEVKLIESYRNLTPASKRQLVLMAAFWKENGDIE